jgi:hypothetical protein
VKPSMPHSLLLLVQSQLDQRGASRMLSLYDNGLHKQGLF